MDTNKLCIDKKDMAVIEIADKLLYIEKAKYPSATEWGYPDGKNVSYRFCEIFLRVY